MAPAFGFAAGAGGGARWWRRCIKGKLSGSSGISPLHCCSLETCVCFLELDESSTVFQSVRRPSFPFTIIIVVECAWPCKLLLRWWRFDLGSTLLPLAILLSIATVSSISVPIEVSVTVVAGSISAAAIACHALRGVAFLEACSDHLRAIDGVENTASSPPPSIALSLGIILVSRIIFGIIVSLASSIPAYRVLSFCPLVGDLHEVTGGGGTDAPKFFPKIFSKETVDESIDCPLF